jgi:hypothetical protein
MISVSTDITAQSIDEVSADTVSPMTVAERIREAMKAKGVGTNGLDRALGKKPGYTSTMLSRGSEPILSGAAEIAKVLGISLLWLATGEGSMDDETPASSGTRHKTFKDLPGWLEAEARARLRYRKIPEVGWLGARMLMAANPPAYIDEAVVLSFAQAWMTSATEDEREAAAEAEGRAAMAAEDEAYRQKLLGLDPPPPPGKPRKRPRKTAV